MTPRGLANARPRGGSGGHPLTPGLAAPDTPLAGRPAPRPGTRRQGLCAYGSLDSRKESYARPGGGTGDTSRPLAWRQLNHGLLRGQLAGRGQFVVPAYCLWVAGLAQGVVRSPEVGDWGTPPHPRLSGT